MLGTDYDMHNAEVAIPITPDIESVKDHTSELVEASDNV